MTYEFKEDEDGDFLVEQTSVLTGLRRVSVDNKVKYRGRLAAPYVSEPANMLVRFTLSKYNHIVHLFHQFKKKPSTILLQGPKVARFTKIF